MWENNNKNLSLLNIYTFLKMINIYSFVCYNSWYYAS